MKKTTRFLCLFCAAALALAAFPAAVRAGESGVVVWPAGSRTIAADTFYGDSELDEATAR